MSSDNSSASASASPLASTSTFVPTVVLMGWPNAGKSMLFNKLTHTAKAIVFDRPGVTRDCLKHKALLDGRDIMIVDTPGQNSPQNGTRKDIDQNLSLKALTDQKNLQTAQEADLILFVIDGQIPLTQNSMAYFDQLRKTGTPILVLVNKYESAKKAQNKEDFYRFGQDPLFISAQYNIGLGELKEQMAMILFPEDEDGKRQEQETKERRKERAEEESVEEEVEEQKEQGPFTLNLAVIGRPNVGKSTLINAFLQKDEQLVAPISGVTRDTVDFYWTFKDVLFKLSDTAGIRRQSHINDPLEKICVGKSILAINEAHVCLLILDAVELEATDYGEPLSQDLNLAYLALKEGRCVVIAVNKFDLVKNKNLLKQKVTSALGRTLSQIPDIPLVFLSALKRQGINDLLQASIELEKKWSLRISTGKLNSWLRQITEQTPPPFHSLYRPKLKYISQIHSRPPFFVICGTRLEYLPESYKRFLIKDLRTTFNLEGIPLRIQWKQQKNPYDQKSYPQKNDQKGKTSNKPRKKA